MVKWYNPNSIEQVVEILKSDNVIPIAGGTDLMVQYKNYHELNPQFENPILNLNEVKELAFISSNDTHIEIGATTTLTDILKAKFIPEVLKTSIKELASPSIRNLGTIVGNICNASPAGDTLPPLYLLNTEINILNPDCDKSIPISSFIKGPRQIFLYENEIVTSIVFEKLNGYKSFYKKIGTRKANSLSKLSVAIVLKTENEIIKDIRISAGAVAPTVVRNKDLEKQFTMKSKNEILENIDKLIEFYSDFINPIDDQRSTAYYRKNVTIDLIKKGIIELLGD